MSDHNADSKEPDSVDSSALDENKGRADLSGLGREEQNHSDGAEAGVIEFRINKTASELRLLAKNRRAAQTDKNLAETASGAAAIETTEEAKAEADRLNEQASEPDPAAEHVLTMPIDAVNPYETADDAPELERYSPSDAIDAIDVSELVSEAELTDADGAEQIEEDDEAGPDDTDLPSPKLSAVERRPGRLGSLVARRGEAAAYEAAREANDAHDKAPEFVQVRSKSEVDIQLPLPSQIDEPAASLAEEPDHSGMEPVAGSEAGASEADSMAEWEPSPESEIEADTEDLEAEPTAPEQQDGPEEQPDQGQSGEEWAQAEVTDRVEHQEAWVADEAGAAPLPAFEQFEQVRAETVESSLDSIADEDFELSEPVGHEDPQLLSKTLSEIPIIDLSQQLHAGENEVEPAEDPQLFNKTLTELPIIDLSQQLHAGENEIEPAEDPQLLNKTLTELPIIDLSQQLFNQEISEPEPASEWQKTDSPEANEEPGAAEIAPEPVNDSRTSILQSFDVSKTLTELPIVDLSESLYASQGQSHYEQPVVELQNAGEPAAQQQMNAPAASFAGTPAPPMVLSGASPAAHLDSVPGAASQAPEPPVAAQPSASQLRNLFSDDAKHQDQHDRPSSLPSFVGKTKDKGMTPLAPKGEATLPLPRLSKGAAKAKKPLEPLQKQSLLGEMIANDFVIMDLIGEGAISVVYVAMEVASDTPVAIKTIKQGDDEMRERFKEAALQQGKLNHANIAAPLSYIESSNGRPFIVTEHINGVALEEILSSVNFIESEDTIASILFQLCDALEHAHHQSVAHGCLTPREVFMMEEDGKIEVKITDFAVASLKPLSAEGGDSPYLSPERKAGGPPTVLSDVYALAVIAYRLICGKFPFSEKSSAESAPHSVAVLRPDLSCAHQINQLLSEAMEANPEWRLDSIRSFKEGLVDWLDGVHREHIATGTHRHLGPEFFMPPGPAAADQALVNQPPSAPDTSVRVDSGAQPQEASAAPSASEAEEKARLREMRAQRNQNITSTIHNLQSHKISGSYDLYVPDETDTGSHEIPSGTTAPQPVKKRKRGPKSRRKHGINKTFNRLTALKVNMRDQEQTLVVKFTDAAASGNQRRSPIATVGRMVALVVVVSAITCSGMYVWIFHQDKVKELFTNASVQMMSLFSHDAQNELAAGDGLNTNTAAPPPGPKAGIKKPQGQAAIAVAPSSQGQNGQNPKPAVPLSRIPRFKYEENQLYSKWIVKTRVGEERRIEKKAQ